MVTERLREDFRALHYYCDSTDKRPIGATSALGTVEESVLERSGVFLSVEIPIPQCYSDGINYNLKGFT